MSNQCSITIKRTNFLLEQSHDNLEIFSNEILKRLL